MYHAPPPALQVSKTFDPTSSFTVRDLKPNTEYVFQLAARSVLGLGAYTPEVRERTLQSSRCFSPFPEFSQGIPIREEMLRLGCETRNGEGAAIERRSCSQGRALRWMYVFICFITRNLIWGSAVLLKHIQRGENGQPVVRGTTVWNIIVRVLWYNQHGRNRIGLVLGKFLCFQLY